MMARTDSPRATVIVVDVSGSAPREVGARMVVYSDGRFDGTIGGGQLEALALAEAQRAIRARKSYKKRVPLGAATGQCCGGVVELFYDVQGVEPHLLIFGAGHVGSALARVMSGTRFKVTLWDARQEWLNRANISNGVIRSNLDWKIFLDQCFWDSTLTYALVMTHSHVLDGEILERLLLKPTKYVGMIGSRSKRERFRKQWLARELPAAVFDQLVCPIGIPLAGKAPQEIAISVAVELLRTHDEIQSAFSADSAGCRTISPHGDAQGAFSVERPTVDRLPA